MYIRIEQRTYLTPQKYKCNWDDEVVQYTCSCIQLVVLLISMRKENTGCLRNNM